MGLTMNVGSMNQDFTDQMDQDIARHPKWIAAIGTVIVYGVTTLIGVVAFLYPFWLPAVTQGTRTGMAHAGDAPLLLTLLVGLAFAVLLLEVQTAAGSAKMVALLGVLVAINSVLRFAEAAIPGPGGFSPIFVLIILGGYVYGARVGFLLGVLTLLVSALVTGGVGPWLPYQMFTAGWVGMSGPLCRPLVRMLGFREKWGEVLLLALLGGLWGLLYGAIMNLWFWPYATGSADQYWSAGVGLTATLQRYVLFYITTSLVWDAMRGIGNVLMILAFGKAILRVLRRFHARFAYTYAPLTPLPAPAESLVYPRASISVRPNARVEQR
jgi:energy-coupling factor transport system substrate-specific component